MTLKIPIKHRTKGTHIMFIDDEDLDKIKDLNLTLNYQSGGIDTNYVKHIVYENGKYIKKINIHRLIMGLGDYKNDKRIINHIDGNGLNNCKSNLEICDRMYNGQSFRTKKKCKNYFYVNEKNRKQKWIAKVKINGKLFSKRFMTEEECKIYVEDTINFYKNK